MAITFRSATDELFSCITHHELAEALGVSVASVRQARLDPAAKARRSPPEGWERGVARLAQERATRLLRLAGRLKA
jgi:hypothetical protein